MRENWLYARVRFVLAGAGKCAWRWVKNGLKLALGRERAFDEKGLFWRQYLLHVTGIRRIRKVTCTGLPGEGAGSQALMVMNAMNFARAFGLTYVHVPFRVVHHAERPMAEWAAAWEALFNLGEGEAVCGSDRREAVNFCYNFAELDVCFPWRRRMDELADRFREMIPEFQQKYYANKSRRETDEVMVAVHVRRGDALPGDADYYTSNETIARTITDVKAVLERYGVKHKLRVYSQGAPADFCELAWPGVEFFLDADAVWTMQELIEADVLIMGKGAYSYCAGLLSDGIKLFEGGDPSGNDFLPGSKWQYVPATEKWIACQANGSFCVAEFERQVMGITEARGRKAR